MNITEPLHAQRHIFTDPHTGREVWQISGWNDSRCYGTYMYMQAFSGDERYVMFASDRTGRIEIYRLELASGEVRQLTRRQSPPDDPLRSYHDALVNVHPDGQEVCCWDGPRLLAIEITSGETRILADLRRQPWTGSGKGLSFSHDGRTLACLAERVDGYYSLLLVDTQAGRFEEVWRTSEPGQRCSHVLIVPSDDRRVSFNMLPDRQNDFDLPPHVRARVWIWEERSGEASAFLTVPVGFRATHEYWHRAADAPSSTTRLYYHKKTQPGWTPASIESIALDGSDIREHYRSDRPLGHSSITPDGRYLVSDVQAPGHNELILIDTHTGRDEVLCWPNSSCTSNNATHVHPSFSPSGEKILFTSDAQGQPRVYVVSRQT